MRYLLGLIFVLTLAAGGVFLVAGRMSGPSIEIAKPEKFVGVSTPLEIAVAAPLLAGLRVVLQQNGKETPLFSLSDPKGANVRQDGADRLRVSQEIGRKTVPDLQSGPARLVVTASRKVVYGIRTVESTATRDVQVRLERPRVSVISTFHFINHGGSEMVVYRVSPADVQSGVLVGDVEYPGYPASGATVEGVRISDPAVRVAFFALLHDQDRNTPIRAFARDEAGNTGRADLDFRVFPKPFKRSRIQLEDRFLDRVVRAILEGTTDVRPEGDALAKFLVINGELRRKNAEKIASFAKQTAPEMLWRGIVFHPFTNTAVESAFADHRTYVYKGKEVDQQTHLGFDLASFAGTPIVSANRGKVLFADELGIYGNCVIVDHGMGVQSLYAHLSSIDVQPGQMVDKTQQLGRSGMTGLAGGDHLHFTFLVNGRMVNPVEWWDAHWIEDRILRKLRTTS
ncbi:MAG: M23 family metallopeptidase [Acidobacteria bacterium]|nr:M23 family metallopeptidase [Acidobacteriota bacterium]MCA1651356.1 M23 family metallopeptidase [Acidobacteriota bacterium]